MEFWGVEVLAGKSLKVRPDVGCLIHISQASLDKGKKGETGLLYVTVDGKKLVIGTLAQGNIPQISFDLVFEKEFELSHNLGSGSVHFVGYSSPNLEDEEDDYSDSEEEEEAVPAAVPTASGNSTVTTNGSNVAKAADSKPKAKPAVVEPESDEDDDESDEEDDSEEDGSDSEKGMDVDEDDSDDEEDDSEDEEDETPKKPEVTNKKRPNESASKTPLSAKKAKPAEEKKGGHTATPHPAKKGGKSPMNANNQSPKSGGQSSGGGSNKKQFNSGKQFGSNNKGKGKGKGRA